MSVSKQFMDNPDHQDNHSVSFHVFGQTVSSGLPSVNPPEHP